MNTPDKALNAVVLGATGYVGGEMLRLIAGHPHMRLVGAVSESRADDPIASVFPHLYDAYTNECFRSRENWMNEIEDATDLALFSAAPHGASAALIDTALSDASKKNINVHVVDSSADFRYSTQDDYETVYGVSHGAPQRLTQFYCGVPEHVEGTPATHIGHPGCFATAILLAAVPLMKAGLGQGDLFVTGVTGSTGSGRSPQAGTHHPERHSNMYAYKPLAHRHAPEIGRLLTAATGCETAVNFVPHSGPFARGIYATVQIKSKRSVTADALRAVFSDAYSNAPFVHLIDGTPKLKNVVASNRCQIGVASNGSTLIVMSAIDNLVKGAAGGAVQWMNRLWGLPETSGLLAAAPAWV